MVRLYDLVKRKVIYEYLKPPHIGFDTMRWNKLIIVHIYEVALNKIMGRNSTIDKLVTARFLKLQKEHDSMDTLEPELYILFRSFYDENT